MISIALGIALIAAICWAFYERGVARGFVWDSENHSRSWNDGFAKAREFYEQPAAESTDAIHTI